MKCLIFTSLLFLGSFASAATFLEKGIYIETDLTIGYGKTKAIAEKDAITAIPYGFRIAKNINSPAIQCTNHKIWNEKNECGADGDVRFVLPIQKN